MADAADMRIDIIDVCSKPTRRSSIRTSIARPNLRLKFRCRKSKYSRGNNCLNKAATAKTTFMLHEIAR